MAAAARNILILVGILTLAIPLNAQNETGDNINNVREAQSTKIESALEKQPIVSHKKKQTRAFSDFLNKKAYAANIDKREEKRILREKWKKLLGVDIFYPYFKAKEMEGWIKDKASIKIFKLKGRPKFENNQIKYTFKVEF